MGVLDIISNENIVLRIRLVVYGVLIFFSFFIFIGVAVMKDEGTFLTVEVNCPLYIEDVLDQPKESNCNFPMAIAIMFQLLFLMFRLTTLVLLLLGKMGSESVLFSEMMDFAWIVTEFFAFFFTFIGACILSAGTNYSCDNLNKINKSDDYCSKLGWYSPSEAAQAGAWISTLLWLFIFIVGFISMYRAGRIPFLGQRAAPKAASGAKDPTPPTMETPPNNPDGMQQRY